MQRKPIHILLVEDNPGDARLAMEVFKHNGLPKTLSVVKDGEEALAFLRREGIFVNASRPDLILLDLNLPKKDGRVVLAEIKGDTNLRRIPVIILTTSCDEEDILRAYDLNANCFLAKPLDLDEFTKVIEGIENFWLKMVELPRE